MFSRGEKLYVTKTKDQGSKNCGKLCCWIFSLALLAGAITVAVLIGSKLDRGVWSKVDSFISAGVIDTDPMKQVKESRKLDTETTSKNIINTLKLLEVTNDEVPNVLTNNPTFFTSRKKEKVVKEDPGKILLYQLNKDNEFYIFLQQIYLMGH